MTSSRDGGNHSLAPDTLYELFAKDHRRKVLSYLEMKDSDVAELGELAEHLYQEVDGITSPDQARLTLTHTHVPKLAEYGVIEYDQWSEIVRYQEGSQVEAMLVVAAAHE